MSVSDGQTGNAATFNAAFGSKTSNNIYTGIQELDAPSSGDTITNLQLEVNGKTFDKIAVEQISAGAEVATSTTRGLQSRKVISDGGAVTASSTPFGSTGGWVDGTQVRLVGTSNTDTVTFTHNDADYGMILNGNATLPLYGTLTVEWDQGFLRWIEVGRNV